MDQMEILFYKEIVEGEQYGCIRVPLQEMLRMWAFN